MIPLPVATHPTYLKSSLTTLPSPMWPYGPITHKVELGHGASNPMALGAPTYTVFPGVDHGVQVGRANAALDNEQVMEVALTMSLTRFHTNCLYYSPINEPTVARVHRKAIEYNN